MWIPISIQLQATHVYHLRIITVSHKQNLQALISIEFLDPFFLLCAHCLSVEAVIDIPGKEMERNQKTYFLVVLS